MAINPLDVMRVQEASQIKHIENQRAQSTQGQIVQSFQDVIQQRQVKTVHADNSENKEYRYDAKEKGNNEYENLGGKKGNKDKKDKKEDNSKTPKKSGGIDILI
jgi:hypothetical protein